ncbi:MAG: GNAT family N-acetyltransferase [Nitrospirae bacterium]|nr:GNAT family N-acetyltransferase [Nitrospirota bacterium]
MTDGQTQTENLIIRRFRHDDIAKILELFSASFSSPESEEWFLWKYERSPWSTAGYVAFDKDSAVAFYGGLKLKFSFRNKTLWAYQFCDVMTHPGYRGKFAGKRPVIVRLGELFYADNRMDFAFGFPSPRHARLQSLLLGGEGYRLLNVYKKEHSKTGFLAGVISINEGWHCLKDNGIDRLLVHDKYEGSLVIAKNMDYLKWRYLERPCRSYSCLTFRSFRRLKGAIVFKVEDGCMDVLEFFYGDVIDIQGIVRSVERYAFRSLNLRGIRFWAHDQDPISICLNSTGYSREDGIPVAFKPVNAECGVNGNVFYDNFLYNMGDYDAS